MRISTSLSAQLCLLAALAASCVEPEQHEPSHDDAPAQASLSSATTARPQRDHSATLHAVKTRDWAALSSALGPNHSQPGAVLVVERGPIDGYQSSAEPVIVRHRAAPPVELLVASATPVAAALLKLDGSLTPLSFELEPADESQELMRLRISQRNIPAQGLLLVGLATSDLLALDPTTLALAVVDDVWACGGAQPQCRVGDYQCIFDSQQLCIEQDLEFLTRYPFADGVDEIDQLINYTELYSNIKNISISAQPSSSDPRGQWHDLTFDAPAGAQLARVVAYNEHDEQPIALAWRQINGAYQVLAPQGGFEPGILIVDTALNEARFDSVGVAQTPAAPSTRALGCKDWYVSACLKVEDDQTQSGSTINRPVAGVFARPATTTQLGLGIYTPWAPVLTDANGCFSAKRTFCGIGAGAKRRHRVTVSLIGQSLAAPRLSVRNPLAFESIFNLGFFRVYQNNSWSSPGSINAGQLLFKPGVGGALGATYRHRQALTWSVATRLDAAFNSQDPWLRFQNPYAIHYPHPLFGGVAMPIVPPTILLTSSQWDLSTLVHEIGHVWHYMHNFGVMPNLITSLINGWSTHNCQEDKNIAFLEGFAEFFSRQVLCGDVFNSAACYGTTPRSRAGLLNHWTCNDEQGYGLTTPGRVSLNDDGVTHALQLLVVDQFYQRNFQSFSSSYNPFSPMPNLPSACQWYPFDNLSLWHVLRTFRANNALGYPTNFPISAPYGIYDFYLRFRAINNLPNGFLQDRLRLWDAGWTLNPIDVCRKPCAELSPWWSGGPQSSTLVNNTRCDIQPVPAGQSAYILNNKYYLREQISCPVGSYDTANCHVLTPAPGTSPFIWNNNLYTTPLPGNVCPHGWYDGANCFIAATPAGTQPFIWNNSLYTTPLYQGCAAGIYEGQNRCYIGTPPPGATAQITAGNFSYPRQ